MKIQIIRKKAASLRELGHEELEIEPVSNLRDLLTCVARAEFQKQHGTEGGLMGSPQAERTAGAMLYADEEELRQQGRLGKIQFGAAYNENAGDWEKALATLFQDFEDGLYRVYVDGTECTDLEQQISIQDGAEVVFIRLVMLAGRLW